MLVFALCSKQSLSVHMYAGRNAGVIFSFMKKIPIAGIFYLVNLAKANLPRNADSMSPSNDISPSLRYSSP